MNLAPELIETLTTYLRDRANQGDEQAQALLAQLEQAQSSDTPETAFFSVASSMEGLGC
jgi:hypothetical protein